jgi:hypothetical protein
MRANADAVQGVAREAKPKRFPLRLPRGDRPCIDYSTIGFDWDIAGTFAGHLSGGDAQRAKRDAPRGFRSCGGCE